MKPIVALTAFVGLLLPVVVMTVDWLAPHGWWPRWIYYAWPTAYMLGANSAFTHVVAHVITVVSALINALIYALVALVAYGVVRMIRSYRG